VIPRTALLAQLLRRARLVGVPWRWPSRCWVCGAWPAQALCEPCVEAFAQPSTRCRQCALPLLQDAWARGPHTSRLCPPCRHTPPPLSACHAALDYDYPWNRCITTFKFGHQPGLARVLAALMWHAPGIAPALEQADLVVPMPLSPHRLQSRGFNQAHELARELERHRTLSSGTPQPSGRYHPHLLHRLRDTQAQSTLNAVTRHANLFHAFQVLPSDHKFVQGRQVVVVDDVMTTGASLHEAARALLLAGAHRVVGVVLARTPAVS
jgi:ComF family protein